MIDLSASDRVRQTTLESGLRVVTETMPHLETAALGVWVAAGSRAEREAENGIAHLLEHMAFKGTERRSARAIAEEIEAVGGELNAVTGLENTAYYARVLKDDVPLAIDILADIIQNSLFDPAELAREQGVIMQEIMAAHDTPDDLVFDLVQDAAFPGQSIGRSVLGTIDSIRGFTAADLDDFLTRNYAPDQMIVAAAGAVDHDALVADIADRFSVVRDASVDPAIPAQFDAGRNLLDRPLEQVHLVMGFSGIPICDRRIYAAQLLSTLLGGGMSSRLFQEIRERRGLCYGIYTYHWAVSDSGLFGLYAGTGPEQVEELADVVMTELAQVDDTVNDIELERAKAQLKAGLMMSLESPSSRIDQMARHLSAFDRIIPPAELIAGVEAVTRSDIAELADAVFGPDRAAVAAVGPEAGLASLAVFGSNRST